jgi:hypothetical protein
MPILLGFFRYVVAEVCGNRTHRTLPYGNVPLVLKTRRITRPNTLPLTIIGEIWKIANSETSPQGDKTQQAYEGEADFSV